MCDDLDLIDDVSGILNGGDDILAAQLRIARHDLVDGIPTGHHTQDVPHHDARATDHRLPRANGRIDFDSAQWFHCLRPLFP
jgi:hypothetical protein